MKYLYLALLCVCTATLGQAQNSRAKVYTSPRLGPGFMTYEIPLRNGDKLLTGINTSGYYLPGDTTGISIIIRTDSLGNPIWAKRYKDPGARRQQFNDHYAETAYEDGQGNLYVMMGHRAALAKVRPDGRMLWVRGNGRRLETSPYRLTFYPNAEGTRFHFLTHSDSLHKLMYTVLDSAGRIRKERIIRYPVNLGSYSGSLNPIGIAVLPTRIHLFIRANDVDGNGRAAVLELDTAGTLLRSRWLDKTFSLGFQSWSVAPLGKKGTLVSVFTDGSGPFLPASCVYFKHSLDSGTVVPTLALGSAEGNVLLLPLPDSSVQIVTDGGDISRMRSDFRVDKHVNTFPLDFRAQYSGQNHSGLSRRTDRLVHTLTDGYYPEYIGYKLGGYGVLGYMEQSFDSSNCVGTSGPPTPLPEPRVTLPLVPFSGIRVQTLPPSDTAWAFYQYDEPLCMLDYCNLPKLELATHQASTCDPTYRVAAPTRIFPGTQHYRWSTGDTTTTVDLPVPGRYILEVSGLCGRYRDSIELTSSPQSITIQPRPVASCPNGELAFGHSTLQPGTVVRWSIGRQTLTSSGDSLYLLPRNPTNRDSSFFLVASIGEGGGCVSRDSVRISLWPGYPNFLGPDILACDPDTILTKPSFGVDNSWVWHLPGGSTSQANFLRVREPGNYAATFSAKGCLYADTILVTSGDFRLPNVVTLNEDNLNRYLRSDCLPSGSMELFNFWGVSVYRNEAYDGLWPPADANAGVYYYRFLSRQGKELTGWVEVVR